MTWATSGIALTPEGEPEERHQDGQAHRHERSERHQQDHHRRGDADQLARGRASGSSNAKKRSPPASIRSARPGPPARAASSASVSRSRSACAQLRGHRVLQADDRDPPVRRHGARRDPRAADDLGGRAAQAVAHLPRSRQRRARRIRRRSRRRAGSRPPARSGRPRPTRRPPAARSRAASRCPERRSRRRARARSTAAPTITSAAEHEPGGDRRRAAGGRRSGRVDREDAGHPGALLGGGDRLARDAPRRARARTSDVRLDRTGRTGDPHRHFRPIPAAAPPSYDGAVRTFRSRSGDEPRAPTRPGGVWRDWALVALPAPAVRRRGDPPRRPALARAVVRASRRRRGRCCCGGARTRSPSWRRSSAPSLAMDILGSRAASSRSGSTRWCTCCSRPTRCSAGAPGREAVIGLGDHARARDPVGVSSTPTAERGRSRASPCSSWSLAARAWRCARARGSASAASTRRARTSASRWRATCTTPSPTTSRPSPCRPRRASPRAPADPDAAARPRSRRSRRRRRARSRRCGPSWASCGPDRRRDTRPAARARRRRAGSRRGRLRAARGSRSRCRATRRPAVPDSVATAAYRLVQESVTNAGRHARRASRIDVIRVRAGDDAVTVEVRDDGERGSARGGRGLRHRRHGRAGRGARAAPRGRPPGAGRAGR